MKASIHFRYSSQKLAIHKKPLIHAITVAIAFYSGNTLAQTVNFPPVPLTVATAVSPNLLYIHDDSSSMYWSHLPDDIHWQDTKYSGPNGVDHILFNVPFEFYRSSDFNKMYYNPSVQYVPPPAPPGVTITGANGSPVTDGTLGNAQFNNAWYYGYDLASRNQSANYFSDPTGTVPRRVNLGTSFVQTDFSSRIFKTPYLGYPGYPIKGSKVGKPYSGTANSCYWLNWYNGVCGTGEFLPMNPEPAHYYKCPANAWPSYPNPKGAASQFKLFLCTKVVITSDTEKQNFANWYSYYRTRTYASKAGIARAFEKLDSSVRVGWGLINKINPRATFVDGKNVKTIMQGVRQFDQQHKINFLNWLYAIQPSPLNNPPVFVSQLPANENANAGTPLRMALDSAGQYYDRSDGSSLGPWADDPARPGTAATEKAAACRKSFTILMTDGYWNANPASNPNIVNKNVDGNAPSPFRDSYANTLADVAWYYWSKKLVPSSIASKVPKTPAPEALSAVPPRYRNDAVHQHMTTFTIGLGVEGSVNKDKAFRAIFDPSAGTITWGNPIPEANTTEKIDDLLHTAVNGHGDFFSAGNPDEFVRGMSSIINSVNSAQKPSSGNLDASTSQSLPVADDAYIYKTHFKPEDWRGELIAQKIDSKTGLEGELWRASEQMPSPTARKITTRRSHSNNRGVSFEWNSLDGTLQNALKGPGQLLDGQKVLDYIRGSNANEGPNANQFRPRYRAAPNRAPLGDSPHNSPVFVKYGEKKTVFLGANDGMLHAFDATTGAEQFAYIPFPLLSKLAGLTNGHDFHVDGEILVTTPAQTPGKYLLAGALGRGGKGLYGLDVSNPENFRAEDVKWELSSPQSCPDPDPNSAYLGNIVSSLAYAEVGGKASVVFGNGYNSCHGRAALGVVNIDTGSATFIKASEESNNGLAAPYIRTDTTANTVSAYAGDLLGKMWRFDLGSGFGTTPKKLFDAGSSQPITAQAVSAALDIAEETKKTFVHFGTGRYLSVSDRSATAQQSIYGLIDESASTLTANDLEQRVFDTPGSVNGMQVKSIKPRTGKFDMNTWKGWYIPLADTGERVVSSPVIVPTTRGDVAIFTTVVPPAGGDPCNPKGSGWLYAVDAQTGGALEFVFLDLNNDGKFDAADMADGKVPSAIRIGDLVGGMPGKAKMVNGRLVVCGLDSGDCVAIATPPGNSAAAQKGRISWREITN